MITHKLDYLTREMLEGYYKSGLSFKEVLKVLNVSTLTLIFKQRELNIQSKDYIDYRSKYNIHYFDVIDTCDKAYWLGFLYADGNVRSDTRNHTISTQLRDVDLGHLLKFKACMEDKRPDSVIRFTDYITSAGQHHRKATYDICNKHLRQAVIDLGCIPNKSLVLTFPKMDIFTDPNLVYDFIRGYIDGDGCLSVSYKPRPYLTISIRGTENMLLGIQKVFPDFKIKSEVDKRTGNTNYKIYCCGSAATLIAKKLYEGANMYLDRKFEKIAYLFSDDQTKSGKDGEV